MELFISVRFLSSSGDTAPTTALALQLLTYLHMGTELAHVHGPGRRALEAARPPPWPDCPSKKPLAPLGAHNCPL